MKKEELIGNIRYAREYHKNSINKVKMLLDGISINPKNFATKPQKCDFGKWFYSQCCYMEGIRNIPIESIQNIEQWHLQVHDYCSDILSIYFEEKKKASSCIGKE